MMRNIGSLALAGAVLMASPASPALGNNPREMPLAEQNPEADLVAVAKLGPRRQCPVTDGSSLTGSVLCADLRIELVLKGDSVGAAVRRVILLQSGMPEMSVDHVPVPGRALFFLRSVSRSAPSKDESVFEPVWGVDSVLPIDDWPWEKQRRKRR